MGVKGIRNALSYVQKMHKEKRKEIQKSRKQQKRDFVTWHNQNKISVFPEYVRNKKDPLKAWLENS